MDKYKLLESSEFWKYLVGYMDNEALIKLPKVPLAIAFKHHNDKLIEDLQFKICQYSFPLELQGRINNQIKEIVNNHRKGDLK